MITHRITTFRAKWCAVRKCSRRRAARSQQVPVQQLFGFIYFASENNVYLARARGANATLIGVCMCVCNVISKEQLIVVALLLFANCATVSVFLVVACVPLYLRRVSKDAEALKRLTQWFPKWCPQTPGGPPTLLRK